jgi:hypothetical protein
MEEKKEQKEKKVIYNAVELMEGFDEEKSKKWQEENPEEAKKLFNK